MKKVHDENLSLALSLSLILATVAVISHHFGEWVGQPLVQIFLIATVYSLLLRIAKMVYSSREQKRQQHEV